MPAVSVRRRVTADEFMRMVEAGVFANGEQVELLDGEMVVMSPEGGDHADVVGHLTTMLVLAYAPSGYTVRPGTTTRAGSLSVPQPDFAVVPQTARGILEVARALLLVEISVSSLRKDLGKKRSLYARAGAPAYWVVDVRAREVRVFEHPQGDDYTKTRVARRGDRLALPAIDREIAVDEIFAPFEQ